MSNLLLLTEVINRTYSPDGTNRCWCALCEKPDQKICIICPWWAWSGELVCVYAACDSCGKAVMDAPKRLGTKLMDKVERNLLNRYPELQTRLPKNYVPSSEHD
jgi:hypothetical protein